MPDINKIKNEVLNGKEEKAPSQTSFNNIYDTQSNQPDFYGDLFSSRRTSNIFLTQSEKDKLDKEGKSILSSDAFISEEDKYRTAAKEQSAISKIGNSLEQLVVGEVLLGTLKGFTDIYDALVSNVWNRVVKGEKTNDFTSDASRFLEELQDKNKENFKIYRENPYKNWDIGDLGWWADNFVSVGSTLSLLIPSKGITWGVGKLGKLIKADKWVSGGINKLAKTARGAELINKGGAASKILKHGNYYGRKINELADLTGTAFLSRIAENYQEARGIYREGYDNILNKLNNMTDDEKSEFLMRNPKYTNFESNEAIANDLASNAATNTFWSDMPLVLMDFIQYKGVESALKGGAKQVTTASIEKAQRDAIKRLALGTAAKEAINTETKGLFGKLGEGLLNLGTDIIKHPGRTLSALELSEGLEEGWQGIVQAANEDLIDSYLDGHHARRTWDSYLTDGQVWEQAFWGALGGIVFQGTAKGLGKLHRIYKAKQALNKEDITKEQYSNFVLSQNEARIAEINNRQENLKQLIDDLAIIEGGRDPEVLKDGTYRTLTNAEDKARVQNRVVDEWVRKFTLDAVDTGNYELLNEFINSKEFSKYLQDNNVSTSILDRKSLQQRVQDVYDLYIKNTEAMLDNVSGDDIDSIRKAARQLTKIDMEIASEYDNIQAMRSSLDQLNGYHPTQFYETVRTIDALFNEYKRVQALEAENEKLYNQHKISKSGYNAQKRMFEEYKKDIQKQLVDESNIYVYNDKEGNERNASEDFASDDVSKMEVALDSMRTSYNFAQEYAETPDQIKKAIDDIIIAKVKLNDKISQSPKTQEDFEEWYNAFDVAGKRVFNARVNRAIDKVRKYLLNAYNIDDAVTQVMTQEFSDVKDPIRKKQLQNAMDILKVGSHSSPELTLLFEQELDLIKQERANRAVKNKVAVENGEEVANPVPPANPTPTTNDSSMGDGKQQTTIDTTDTVDTNKPPIKEGDGNQETFGPEEEEVDEAGPEIEAIAKQEAAAVQQESKEGDDTGVKEIGLQFASSLSVKTEEDIKREIRSALINLGRIKPDLLSAMIKDGIGSAAYNQFIELATGLITTSGLYLRSEISPIIDYQLKVYLHNLVSKNEVSPEQKKGIFTLINEIDKIKSKEIVDGNFSKISPMSEEEFNNNMEIFLDKYFGLGGKVSFETKNGVKIINVDGLFKQLLELSKAGIYNFEEVAEIVNNIYNYANNYKGRKYSFVSDGIFDTIGSDKDVLDSGYFEKNGTTKAKVNNLSQFINKVYLQQTAERVLIDDNMHFNISSTIRPSDLQKAKNSKLQIGYETIGGVETISLYYLDKKGNKVEIGYLGKVEQGTKDNNTLKLVNETGIVTSVIKQDGEYHTTNNRIEEILYSLANAMDGEFGQNSLSKLAKFLYSQYEFGVNQSQYHELTIDDINEILNNDIFAELLDITNVKLPIGKEYKRANGSKGRSNIKVTAESLKNMNDSDKRKYTLKVLKDINKILFYPYYSSYALTHEVEISPDALRSGIRTYIEKVYQNYNETLNYQHAIDNNKQDEINISLVAENNATLNFDKGVRQNIGSLGIKGSIADHPFVYVAADGSIKVEGLDKSYPNQAGFKIGSSGILMDVRAGYPMIALFVDANHINKELTQALNEEYKRLIGEYYNAVGDNIIDAYNNLYNFFNNILGKNSLFNGWRLNKTDNSFTIFKKDENDKIVPLVEFYKYGANYNYATNTFSVDGEVIPESELKNHYNHIIHYYSKDKSGKLKRYRIKKNEGKENIAKIDELFNDFASELVYSASAITTDSTKTNGFVNKHDKGITINIGKFSKTYKNYADFLVQNNAFKTTHLGVNKTTTYATDSNESTSIYVKYTGTREYINEEEKRRQQGFRANLDERGIKTGDEESAEDLLLDAGYSQNDLQKFEDLFKVLMPQNVVINFDDKQNAFAEFVDGKIHIYKRGIEAITARKEEGFRIMIHENVHRQIANSGFFTSHKYGTARTEAIIDTWDQFYKVSKNNESLKDFIENFTKEYGHLKLSENFEDRAKFANEWVAEVLSNGSLVEYLNNIDYQGNLEITQGSNRKSILQRILDVIKELFTKLNNINKNSLLDQLYKAVGNPVINTYKQELTNTVETTTTQETGDLFSEESEEDDWVVNEKEIDAIIEGAEDNEDLFGDLGESFDIDSFSKVEGLPEEIMIEGYLQDTKDNPNGLSLATNMDNWLQGIAPHNRPTMLSEMANGGLEYICR